MVRFLEKCPIATLILEMHITSVYIGCINSSKFVTRFTELYTVSLLYARPMPEFLACVQNRATWPVRSKS